MAMPINHHAPIRSSTIRSCRRLWPIWIMTSRKAAPTLSWKRPWRLPTTRRSRWQHFSKLNRNIAGQIGHMFAKNPGALHLGGGKFVNGAVTAAFARFFNDELHPDKFSAANDKYHHFDVRTPICRVNSVCTQEAVFEARRQMRNRLHRHGVFSS